MNIFPRVKKFFSHSTPKTIALLYGTLLFALVFNLVITPQQTSQTASNNTSRIADVTAGEVCDYYGRFEDEDGTGDKYVAPVDVAGAAITCPESHPLCNTWRIKDGVRGGCVAKYSLPAGYVCGEDYKTLDPNIPNSGGKNTACMSKQCEYNPNSKTLYGIQPGKCAQTIIPAGTDCIDTIKEPNQYTCKGSPITWCSPLGETDTAKPICQIKPVQNVIARATGESGEVKISWDNVTGAESYNIYWSTTYFSIANKSTLPTNKIDKISKLSNSYTHSGLTNDKTYYYTVTATYSNQESGAFDWSSAKLFAPAPTATLTPTPRATTTPTVTPTADPTVTIKPYITTVTSPTGSPTEGATGSPTRLPTDNQQKTLTIGLDLKLPGVGTGVPNNTNPLRPTRTVTAYLFDARNNLAKTATGDVSYNSSTGSYKGDISINDLPTGQYRVEAKLDNTLQTKIPGIVATTQQNTTLPTATFIPGDIDQNNVLDLKDYNTFISCFGTKSCGNLRVLLDLNDDKLVNEKDLNVLLRSFESRQEN